MSQWLLCMIIDHSALPDLVLFSIWADQVQFWFSPPAKQRCHLSVPEPEKYLQNICLKNKTNNDETNAAARAILNCQQTTLVQGLCPCSIFSECQHLCSNVLPLFLGAPPFLCGHSEWFELKISQLFRKAVVKSLSVFFLLLAQVIIYIDCTWVGCPGVLTATEDHRLGRLSLRR